MNNAIDEILGVVVLYNNTVDESITLTSINESLLSYSDFLDVLVYDNSEQSGLESGSVFKRGQLRIHYFHDAFNPGISMAYNFGAKYASELKKRWLLLLDQDTSFPLDSISKYLDGIKENPEIRLFAPVLRLSSGKPISPCRYFFKRGFALKRVYLGVNRLENITLLNSGMLIHLEAFLLLGGYNEDVKLDFCDYLFIEKFKKLYSSCVIIDCWCLHDFSDEGRDIGKLNLRYGGYCLDARNCDRESGLDWVQYFIVVLVRGCSLVLRTKRVVFFGTFWDKFIRGI
jgi:rhamnosyltransferase